MVKSLEYLVKIVEERDSLSEDLRNILILLHNPQNIMTEPDNAYSKAAMRKIVELQKENAELKAELEQRNAVIPK